MDNRLEIRWWIFIRTLNTQEAFLISKCYINIICQRFCTGHKSLSEGLVKHCPSLQNISREGGNNYITCNTPSSCFRRRLSDADSAIIPRHRGNRWSTYHAYNLWRSQEFCLWTRKLLKMLTWCTLIWYSCWCWLICTALLGDDLIDNKWF